MKLAEALNQRADLLKRVAQIKDRLFNNAKVQEGDKPAESPEDLFEELESTLEQLEELIIRINKTNQETYCEGRTLTEMIAEKDILSMHLTVLRNTIDATVVRIDRYTRNEIKYVSTIDVPELRRKVDKISKILRELDTKLQMANWMTELM